MQNEPELIIHVTDRGVTKVRIPFDTLADQRAGEELRRRCAPVIASLSQIARESAGEPTSPEVIQSSAISL